MKIYKAVISDGSFSDEVYALSFDEMLEKTVNTLPQQGVIEIGTVEVDMGDKTLKDGDFVYRVTYEGRKKQTLIVAGSKKLVELAGSVPEALHFKAIL